MNNYFKWYFNNNSLSLISKSDTINVKVLYAWDWENNQSTFVFTGLKKDGKSIWGKKLNEKKL